MQTPIAVASGFLNDTALTSVIKLTETACNCMGPGIPLFFTQAAINYIANAVNCSLEVETWSMYRDGENYEDRTAVSGVSQQFGCQIKIP